MKDKILEAEYIDIDWQQAEPENFDGFTGLIGGVLLSVFLMAVVYIAGSIAHHFLGLLLNWWWEL